MNLKFLKSQKLRAYTHVHTFGGEAGSPYETEGIGLHWKCCTKLFSVPEKEEVRKSREKWPQLLRDESARDSMVLAFRKHVKKKRMALMVFESDEFGNLALDLTLEHLLPFTSIICIIVCPVSPQKLHLL